MKNNIEGSKLISKNQSHYSNGEDSFNTGNNQTNISVGSNQDSNLSNTSLDLTPERHNNETLILSIERPSNSLLTSIPNNSTISNPDENRSTTDLSTNNMHSPSILQTPNNPNFPSFSDESGNVTPIELITPKGSSIGINTNNNVTSRNISSTNLSSENTNYSNHGTVGSYYGESSLGGYANVSETSLDRNYIGSTPGDSNLDFRRQQIISSMGERYNDLNYSYARRLVEYSNNEYERQLVRNEILTNFDDPVPLTNLDIPDFTSVEIDIPKKGVLGKIKLGLNYLGSKVQIEVSKLNSIYIKYHDVSKRHFY